MEAFLFQILICRGRGGCDFRFLERKLGKELAGIWGSNRHEVTLKFCKQNFSLLSAFVLQQFRTQPI